VSLNLAIEEGSEVSHPAGDGRNEGMGEINYVMNPEVRDLTVESVYEYGSRAGVWRIQRLLDDLNLKCTVFACAVALEKNPAIASWIRDSGHEACAHGWRWEEVWTLSRDEERRHMLDTIDAIANMCGERPLGWCCRYGPSVHTRELLVEEGGFLYDSDSCNDDLPYFVRVHGNSHLVVPYTMTYNDGRYIVGDFADPSSFLDYCKRGFDYLWEEGATAPKMMSIGLHPRLTGQAGRASALKEFLEYALERGQVWFTRRVDIARWWLDHHEEFAQRATQPLESDERDATREDT
jgi:peptidoglycan/xylan/chitin deacetylase (PgdA/CDA1 family)